MLLDFRFQHLDIGTLQTIDFRLISVENERRHGADTLRCCCVLAFVHVDLQENRAWIFVRKLFEQRGNSLAWTAPETHIKHTQLAPHIYTKKQNKSH